MSRLPLLQRAIDRLGHQLQARLNELTWEECTRSILLGEGQPMWRNDYTRRGEDHPNAKLTRKQIDLAKERRALGVTLRELAEEAGVSIPVIREAINGDSYQG